MPITLEMFLSIGGLLVALGGFAFGIMKWVIGQVRDRDISIQAESARAKMAEDALNKDLANHKIYAAEHFATASDLARALEKVEQAIVRLADRLDKILMVRKDQ